MLDKIWNRKILSLPMLLVQLLTIILGRLGDLFISILWRTNLGKAGKGTKIQIGTIIRYPNNISLAENSSIGRNVEINTEFTDSKCDIVAYLRLIKMCT